MKKVELEKQASSEIAQSREQFEKRGNEKAWNLKRRPDGSYDNPFTAYRWDDWQIAWQAAELGTRKRCAQEIKEASRRWRDPGADIVDFLAERIRGKE
jgi:hypothetical protein